MKIFTCKTNIQFPFKIIKDKFLIINTEKKFQYVHLNLRTDASTEKSIEMLCDYIENNKIDDDVDVYINETTLTITKSTKNTTKYSKIESRILDLRNEDRQIENLLGKFTFL